MADVWDSYRTRKASSTWLIFRDHNDFTSSHSVWFPAPSLWRSIPRLLGWVRRSTSCSWGARRWCASLCRPASFGLVSTTWTLHWFLLSQLNTVHCVNQVSKQPVLLSSSSTTPVLSYPEGTVGCYWLTTWTHRHSFDSLTELPVTDGERANLCFISGCFTGWLPYTHKATSSLLYPRLLIPHCVLPVWPERL